jgi:hypothetical protein
VIPILKALDDPKQRRALYELRDRLQKKEQYEAKKGVKHDQGNAGTHKA